MSVKRRLGNGRNRSTARGGRILVEFLCAPIVVIFILSEVDPAWLSRVVATAEAGTAAGSAATTSSGGGQLMDGGYQGSWATTADGAPGASGSAMPLDGSGLWCRWSN